MAAAAPLIISSLLTAGAGAVQGSKQRSASRKIAAKGLEDRSRLARKQSTQELAKVTRDRQSNVDASRLARASATASSNVALKNRGIAARPLASFSDITRNVLDTGKVG